LFGPLKCFLQTLEKQALEKLLQALYGFATEPTNLGLVASDSQNSRSIALQGSDFLASRESGFMC
jgi:hypothetical protein